LRGQSRVKREDRHFLDLWSSQMRQTPERETLLRALAQRSRVVVATTTARRPDEFPFIDDIAATTAAAPGVGTIVFTQALEAAIAEYGVAVDA
jgi:hypothetical protein